MSDRVLRTSRYRRIFRGVYISAEVDPTEEERVVGALALHPEGAWASHRTAAAWCGIAVPHSAFVHVSVTDPKDRRWQPGLKAHVAPPGTRTRTWRGVPVSEPVRMFVELASMLDLVDLVVAGDSMVRVLGMTAADLRAGLERTSDYWSPAARYAAGFVRDGVRSPMETRVRLLLVLAGLPEPAVAHRVRAANGDVLLELDLAYVEHRLAIEYHGTHHRDDSRTWQRDLRRSELVDRLDWHVVNVTGPDIYSTPGATLERVRHAARAVGLLLPRPQAGWEAHFLVAGRAG
ncbi:hypothetical protein QWY28_05035 [Nocardioides sp. SOB77]|uniref:DUF559 domain-containing protein n=1 Tax=Nocardioides oceani TaxID=3058369 RepID=A0ABT8FCB2_9ACTN|nr:hypothetical protein [Nocardioides oceani]MDN4172296.1 hypothetical protein [Nocardioides oceani]